MAFKVLVPATGQLINLQAFKVKRTNGLTASSFKLGIYSDNGSGTAPDLLMRVVGINSPNPPPPVDFILPVENLPVSSGQVLWLAFSTTGGTTLDTRGLSAGDTSLEMVGFDMPDIWTGGSVPDEIPKLLAGYCH